MSDKTERKKEVFRTVKFTLFSISAGIIQIAADALFNEVFHFEAHWSYLIALVLSVLWNFTLNRNITFRSAGNIPIAMLKVAAYYAVFTPLSTLWTKLLTADAGWNEYLVLGLTMLVNFVTEYLFQRFVVFSGTIDTKGEKNEKAGDGR